MQSFNNESERAGKTYRFIGPTKLYITINRDSENVIREVFINAASSGSTTRSLCEALGRAISIALQNRKELVHSFVKKFNGDLSESQWHNREVERSATSIPDAVSLVLKRELELGATNGNS
jgi:hypothetical protein